MANNGPIGLLFDLHFFLGCREGLLGSHSAEPCAKNSEPLYFLAEDFADRHSAL